MNSGSITLGRTWRSESDNLNVLARMFNVFENKVGSRARTIKMKARRATHPAVQRSETRHIEEYVSSRKETKMLTCEKLELPVLDYLSN
jgi:hypothetical protein